LVDRYNTIFMPQDGWVRVNSGIYKDQLLPTLYIANTKTKLHVTASNILGSPSLGNALSVSELTDESDFARDAGVTIWGNILDGMVKYYVGIYDGFGDHNVGEAIIGNGKDNLAYAIRIQFTPTMLGFQGEKGYLLKETYLGKKNVLSFGIAFAYSKLDLGGGISFKPKSWDIDANWEQKLNLQGFALVPKIEIGYIYTDADNLPIATAANNAASFTLDKVKTYYITVGSLYDQQLWLGKIGAYIKYQNIKVETNGAGDVKPSVWTVAIPYYLADQNAKIVLQWNHYDYDKKGFDPRNANDDTNNDFTLAFQVQF